MTLPHGEESSVDSTGYGRRFRADAESRTFVSDDYTAMLGHLRRHGRPIRIDRQGLAQYLTFGHIIGPRTLVEGIEVAPLSSETYCPAMAGWAAARSQFQAREAFPAIHWGRISRAFLEQAIAGALHGADQPALLLSGGFDSTLLAERIVAMGRAPTTWSVGFGISSREGQSARRVAGWLGTQHRHLRLTATSVARRLRQTVRRLGFPTGNPSSMATDLAAEAIAPEADVLFSGLGSDELFGGHYKHIFARYWPVMKYVAAARVWSRTFRQAGRAPHKIFSAEFAEGYQEFYHLVTPEMLEDLFRLRGRKGRDLIESQDPGGVKGRSVFDIDRSCWLLSGLVPQAARLAAAHDIDLALPFCEPSLQTALRRLPMRYKVKGLTGKWILRRAYAREIPAWVAKQPRAGFALPLAQWLRGPLKGLLDEYLDREVVAARGIFDPDVVRSLVGRHLHGRINLSLALWSLITLEVWQREFLD